MTRLLETYLKIAFAGNSEAKTIVERDIPRELTTIHSDKVHRVRELLISEDITSTSLIQTEMYATVMEGANPVKCVRNALPVYRMTGNQMTMTLRSDSSYAAVVAEGAEIPIDTGSYTTRTWTATKKAVRPLITKELIEDGLYDVVSMEVRNAGEAIENQINREMLTVLLDNAGNEHDTAGTNQGIKAVAGAIKMMKNDNIVPDTLIMCPEAEALIMADSITTWNAKNADVMNSYAMGRLLGLDVYELTTSDSSSTYAWEYNSDSDIGMLVVSKTKCGGTGVKRDITIERYNDPIRDLVGCSVTARTAAQYGLANAICRVEF